MLLQVSASWLLKAREEVLGQEVGEGEVEVEGDDKRLELDMLLPQTATLLEMFQSMDNQSMEPVMQCPRMLQETMP